MKRLIKVSLLYCRYYLAKQYRIIHNYVAFQFAKRKAIMLHKTDGKMYHVLPKTPYGFRVVNNSYLKVYNKVLKHNRIYINDLLKMSYFSTPSQGITRGIL